MTEIIPKALEGPIVLGMQQNRSNTTPNKTDQRSLSLTRRAQGYFFAFFVIGTVGLAVGAFVHRQWIGLPWVGMVWSPLPILFIIFIFKRKLRLPDEQVISAIDWLTQQAKQQGLASVLDKGAKLVWLTSQGVYALPRKYFPWTSFMKVSIEEELFGRVPRPALLLKLQLKKPRTTTKWWTYSFVGVSFLLSCVGSILSYICFRQYGLRDDVLSLIFAVLAALNLESEIILRYHEQHRWEKFDFELLFDQQHIQFAELYNFLTQHLPESIVSTATKKD
jgi:hypothetical protein